MNPSDADESSRPSVIPFLITHWLSQYGNEIRTGDNYTETLAIARIQSATIELSQAFASLGAFGTTLVGHSSLVPDDSGHDVLTSTLRVSNASYQNIVDRFTYQLSFRKNLLESIVASSESVSQSIHPDITSENETCHRHWLRPLLQAPTLLTSSSSPQISSLHPTTSVPATIRDNSLEIFIAAAQASRRYLDLQFKIQQELCPQQSMMLRSKKFHQRLLQQQQDQYQENANRDVSQRVLLQLEKNLGDIEILRRQMDRDCQMALSILCTLWKEAIFYSTNFAYSYNLSLNNHGLSAISKGLSSNTIVSHGTPDFRNLNTVTAQKMKTSNGILRSLIARQYAVGRSNTVMSKRTNRVYYPSRKYQSLPLSVSFACSNSVGPTLPTCRIPKTSSSQPASSISLIKTILSSRMSHCTTINAHLTFPVYCFCFDKSGKYFFTGADDHLVKAFRLIPTSNVDLEDTSSATRSSSMNEEFMNSSRTLNNPTLLYDKKQDWSGEDNVLLSPSPNKQLYSKASNSSHNHHPDYNKTHPNIRGGAILVATFRGHAGVINDMDVSADNSMLATASVDGDVRVWTLHGSKRTAMGIPVAILRGHTGGANMVSWSYRVPYQLVTTSQDGWARVWDVRLAAVKRSVNVLGARLDYSWVSFDYESSSTASLIKKKGNNMREQYHLAMSHSEDDNECKKYGKTNGLEPIDIDKISTTSGSKAADIDKLEPRKISTRFDESSMPIEDRREGMNSLSLDGPGQGQISLGAFVSGSSMDQGVILIGNLFHGGSAATPAESTQSVTRRSRSKAVSVICVSRCPLGGHFATGSDDGVGRMWSEDEETRIEDLDSQLLDHLHATRRVPSHTSSNSAHLGSLLATLTGHLNAITDIQYSYAGDRLLTASQKDGVVRVWSWGSESLPKTIDNFRQVIIRLTKNTSIDANIRLESAPSGHGRRRGGLDSSTASIGVYCDVAIWSSDDAKIITSQYSPLRLTTTEPIPGSQAILIWDSYLGQCLIGINVAHSAGCPVLISHPSDSSLLVSAGGDGYVKMWDLEDGNELFSYLNSLEHGPIEPPLTKGQCCGFLDGDFSDDGLTLILTDELGRVCIFDALHDAEGIEERERIGHFSSPIHPVVGCINGQVMKEPAWMKEQYFANDYYELFYDSNGYSVEQGSGQPTHLAPRAARCNHNGVPYSERIQDSFRRLTGPMPIEELDVRTARETLRTRAFLVRKPGGILEQNINGKRLMVRSHGMESTLYVGPKISPLQGLRSQPTSVAVNNANNSRRSNNQTGRTLSSNYRWSDFDDMQEDVEVDDLDEDDEDYFETAINTINESFEDDDHLSVEEDSDESVRISTRNQRRRDESGPGSRRRSRSSRRIINVDEDEVQEKDEDDSLIPGSKHNLRVNANQRFRYDDPDSSDEEIEELLSRTKIPSGEFAEDYNTLGHYFKMPNKSKVFRNWVLRTESSAGYTGQKAFCPQVGDSVIYIPRAHYDTLRTFPNASNMSAPWKSFPTDCAWPIVRCSVKDLRYRFPYEMYYRSSGSTKVVSVIVILTLEVTGVPDRSLNRKYPWPKPKFIATPSWPNPLVFNVSLFLNGEVDFLIPEALFIWRIASLEQMIRQEKRFVGLLINTQFNESDGKEDDDSCFVPYPGEIFHANPSYDEELHFQNSGYNVISVRFPHNDLTESMCIWEISPASGRYNGPRPFTLDRDQKTAVGKIIDELEEDTDIQTYFSLPVDSSRYVDYLSIIEVPMNFSFIRQRLKNDYYSNLLGVSSDMRLIRDNCFKYNESDSAISITARDMFDRFMQRFDALIKSDIGQRELKVDRHLPLVPDDDEEIDILDYPRKLRAEPKNSETISESNTPLRRSARFASNETSNIQTISESNLPGRRNRSSLNNRVSNQLSVAESHAVNSRLRSRSSTSLRRHENEVAEQSRQDSHIARLTRSSNSEIIRESRSSSLLDEDRSSPTLSGRGTSRILRPVHLSNSNNMRATRSNSSLVQGGRDRIPQFENGSSGRRLRSLNAGSSDHLRSSLWENNRGTSNSSTTIRIRTSANSDRIRGHPSDNIPLSISPPSPIASKANRSRSRSALQQSNSILTDHLPKGEFTLQDSRTTRRQTRTLAHSLLHDQPHSVLMDHVPRHNVSSEDVTTRRLTRNSTLSLLSPCEQDESRNSTNKTKNRRTIADHLVSKSESRKKRDSKSPSRKTIATKTKVADTGTKTRNRNKAKNDDFTQDSSSDENSLESQGNRKRLIRDSDYSDASFEEEYHNTRRVTRKTSRKVSSYKEESDEYADESDSNSDDSSKRQSLKSNRIKKRGRWR